MVPFFLALYCALCERNKHLILPNREGSTNICLQGAAHELCMSPVSRSPTLTLLQDSSCELLALQNHCLIMHNMVRRSLPNKPTQATKREDKKNPNTHTTS